jgi:hypothetical protein
MSDSDYTTRMAEIDRAERLGNRGLPASEADMRHALVPFYSLWLDVFYKRWEHEDHFAEPLIVQIDLYADRELSKLLGENLLLKDFTTDQSDSILNNLDSVLVRRRKYK